MCVQRLQIRMLFKNILDERVDIVTDGVDLRVDIMQVDFIRRRFIFFR